MCLWQSQNLLLQPSDLNAPYNIIKQQIALECAQLYKSHLFTGPMMLGQNGVT